MKGGSGSLCLKSRQKCQVTAAVKESLLSRYFLLRLGRLSNGKDVWHTTPSSGNPENASNSTDGGNNLHAEKGYVHLVRTRLLGDQVQGIGVTQ